MRLEIPDEFDTAPLWAAMSRAVREQGYQITGHATGADRVLVIRPLPRARAPHLPHGAPRTNVISIRGKHAARGARIGPPPGPRAA